MGAIPWFAFVGRYADQPHATSTPDAAVCKQRRGYRLTLKLRPHRADQRCEHSHVLSNDRECVPQVQ